jgi:hypothetical protein
MRDFVSAEMRASQAERDRLREALEWIANGEDWTAMGVRAVARAALRPAQDEQR